jgi:hypothetical protein
MITEFLMFTNFWESDMMFSVVEGNFTGNINRKLYRRSGRPRRYYERVVHHLTNDT